MPDTPSFDLRTEPWIPATFISDGQEHMVSLTDALLNARDIRSIGGDMPIQTPADHPASAVRALRALPRRPAPRRVAVNCGTRDRSVTTSPTISINTPTAGTCSTKRTPFFQVADLRTEKGTYSGLEKTHLRRAQRRPVLHHATRRGIATHLLRRGGTLAGHRPSLRPVRHQNPAPSGILASREARVIRSASLGPAIWACSSARAPICGRRCC